MNGQDIFQKGLMGASISTMGDLVAFPLERVKLEQQISYEQLSMRGVISNLFKRRGFRAFYEGYPRYQWSRLQKNFIIWPVLIGFPKILKENFGISNSIASQAVNAVFITTIDTGISVPFANLTVCGAKNACSSKVSWDIYRKKRDYKLVDGNIYLLSERF